MKSSKLGIGLAGLLLASQVYSAEECDRSPRQVVYNDSPVDIYISNDQQRAEVIFPEDFLEGIFLENPNGVNFYRTPINNKLAFQASQDMYTGLAYIDGPSKKTYLINLISRPGCADSQVSIGFQALANRGAMERTNKGQLKGLMNYMFEGKTPSGYRNADFSKMSREDRVVFKQGSVEFILASQIIGPKYVGTTYEVVNNGRTATKIAIDQIDYSDKSVKNSIGIARQVSMLPSTFILGPSPEFLTEVYNGSHRGLMFIVSEKNNEHK